MIRHIYDMRWNSQPIILPPTSKTVSTFQACSVIGCSIQHSLCPVLTLYTPDSSSSSSNSNNSSSGGSSNTCSCAPAVYGIDPTTHSDHHAGPFRLATYNTASTPLQDTQEDDTVQYSHRGVLYVQDTRYRPQHNSTSICLWYLASRHVTNSLHNTPSPSTASATTKRRLVLLPCSLLNSCSPGHLRRSEPTQQQHGKLEVC